MLTIEEQIERIADHAFERAIEQASTLPRRSSRRWPILTAAAVLIAVSAVTWAAVPNRADRSIRVAPASSEGLAARIEGALEYPLNPADIGAGGDLTGVLLEEPGSLRAVRTADGTTVFRVSGLQSVPGSAAFQGRCAGLLGRAVGCDLPAAAGIPWVLGTADGADFNGLSIWVDVPTDAAVILVSDGDTTWWQRPVNGLAVWPTASAASWTAEAIDATGATIATVDASIQADARRAIADAFDPNDLATSDAAVIQRVRDCLTAKGVTITLSGTRPVFPNGTDAANTWAECTQDASIATSAEPASPAPTAPGASADSLVLGDPGRFDLSEVADPDDVQSVFCLDYLQSAPAQCLQAIGDARRSYRQPNVPDEAFEVGVVTSFVGDGSDDFRAASDAWLGSDEITSSSEVDVRGTTGVQSVLADGQEVLVWTERPGVVVRLSLANRPSGLDPLDVAEALIEDQGPATSSLPFVAMQLGSADVQATRSFVLVHREGAAECVSVDWVTAENTYGRCTGTPSTVWWSTVSHLDPGLYGDRDVVFGLAPEGTDHVELTFDEGNTVSLDTVAVPGFVHRAWAYVVPASQGTRFAATLLAAGQTSPIDFVHPVVRVDDVCSNAGNDATTPDVVGLPIFEAAEVLRSNGVVIADRLRGDPAQVVIAQNPPAGTWIGCGDTQLTVGPPTSNEATPKPAAEPATTSPRPQTAVTTCGNYTVIKGDFAVSIATKFDVTLDALVAANDANLDSLFPGDVIAVPCQEGAAH